MVLRSSAATLVSHRSLCYYSAVMCRAGMRQGYLQLYNLNYDLIDGYHMRSNNHQKLLDCLKQVNQVIQRAGQLRCKPPSICLQLPLTYLLLIYCQLSSVILCITRCNTCLCTCDDISYWVKSYKHDHIVVPLPECSAAAWTKAIFKLDLQ